MKRLPHGVCQKNGSTYRRFKVRDKKRADGRWVDLYVRLPPPDDPEFPAALEKANEDAINGVYGDQIGVRDAIS